MGKLIMWNLMTLDGMFEGPRPWDLDWHEYAWGDELKRFSLEHTHSSATPGPCLTHPNEFPSSTAASLQPLRCA